MIIFNEIINSNKSFIDDVWKKIDTKLKVVAPRTRDKLPLFTENGKYNNLAIVAPNAWTNGFWPAIMWLMYVGTNNDLYKDIAIHGEELMESSVSDFDELYHDVGFLWHITSGIHYRLLGDKKAKSRTMYMAASLMSRYNMNTKCIRAFQPKEQERMVIIDCMMNIPLLYWASREMDDPRFKLVAQSHADTTMKYHIRDDGSVNHILEYDLQTGEMLGAVMGQGVGTDTSWTRGQAWGIYGFILSYIHTGKKEYLDTAKKVAHYFISAVSLNDYVAPYDFRQPIESTEIDTSASAIAACGLIEIAKVVNDNEKALYLTAAIKIIKALTNKHCDWSNDTDAILQNVAIAPNYQNVPGIFGEYFFIEAIYKLKGFEPLFW